MQHSSKSYYALDFQFPTLHTPFYPKSVPLCPPYYPWLVIWSHHFGREIEISRDFSSRDYVSLFFSVSTNLTLTYAHAFKWKDLFLVTHVCMCT